jgi:hypothetical protein
MMFESEKLEVDINKRSLQDSMRFDMVEGIVVFAPVNWNGPSCETMFDAEVFATQTLPKASPVRSILDLFANDSIGVF